ncbi:prepilin peptidase [Candidatus Nanohalococcus occultus]|uniref:prepilin peptidase n=1 Tax=Candidatus Nanohalococcus occultus TaxID=2978047 RepID=UPI0039E0FB95
MLIAVSHLICFLSLSIGSVYDLLTTEVPDQIPAIAVLSGILLHAAASYFNGSLMPLKWSLAAGAFFSIYGWGMYFAGMWGGADAFSVSALGFAAPYGLAGFGLMHSVNLFVNMMLIGFGYTLLYAFYKAARTGGVLFGTIEEIKSDRKQFLLEILAAGAFGTVAYFVFSANYLYVLSALTMVVLYRFLKQLEDDVMVSEVAVEDLEEGEVVVSGEVGQQVKGITQEEIDGLEVDEVTVKTGVRFVPVFPLALLVTDLYGGGISFLMVLFSL